MNRLAKRNRLAALLFAAAALFSLGICAPAWAQGELAVDQRLECVVDGLGRTTLPTATLSNLCDCDITITAVDTPRDIPWSCNAVGKTIPARTSISASWAAPDALPDAYASLITSAAPAYFGEITYHYTYEKPIPNLYGTVSIEGKRTTTSTLRAKAAQTPPNVELSWQWYKDGAAIDGANSESYTLQEGDDGHAIECRATDASGAYLGDIRAQAGAVELAFYLGYTMAETKAIAGDIARNKTASRYYAEMAQGLQDDAKGTMRLRDGSILTFRLAGILHDDATSGGKAGLTFVARHALPKAGRMNPENTNIGGWKASEARASLNSGELWELFSDEFQRSVCSVEKLSNNDRGTNKNAEVSATSDKLWLLSAKELTGTINSPHYENGPSLDKEGAQYPCFRPFFQSSSDRPKALAYEMMTQENGSLPDQSTGNYSRMRSVTNMYDTTFYLLSGAGNPLAPLRSQLLYAITPGWSMGEAS